MFKLGVDLGQNGPNCCLAYMTQNKARFTGR